MPAPPTHRRLLAAAAAHISSEAAALTQLRRELLADGYNADRCIAALAAGTPMAVVLRQHRPVTPRHAGDRRLFSAITSRRRPPTVVEQLVNGFQRTDR